MRVRRPLFGRKPRPVAEEPEYEDDNYTQDEAPVYEEDEPEEEPVRVRKPLFGRKARPVADEPEYEDDEYGHDKPSDYDGKEPEGTIEFRFEEQQPVADQPLIAETDPEIIKQPTETEQENGTLPTAELETLTVEAELIAQDQEPEATEAAADNEPAEETPSFKFEEPQAEEPAIVYKEPIRIQKVIRVKDAETEPEEVPSSITIDMDVQEFDDEDDDYDDGGYVEEDSVPAAPVYKTDYKSAYKKSVRAESDRMTRGMIAAIITVSSLLVVTLVVLGVLLIGKTNRTAPVIATTAAPTEAVTQEPAEAPTPSPAAEITPSPTPVPTTPPEEDFGSVFEQPTDGLLPEVDN